MSEDEWLAERFEADRGHLTAVAYRMLGSAADAEDAVQEAILADSVGLALLVVLEKLNPAERVAFVLHDLFALPFAEIAPILGRSRAATRQLASRARRRVRGESPGSGVAADRKRKMIDSFLAAARVGDFDALLEILDPDVVLRIDRDAVTGSPAEVRGAATVAERAVEAGARAARPALVDGDAAVVVAPLGRLLMVLDFTIAGDRVVAIDAIADRKRLEHLDLAIFAD